MNCRWYPFNMWHLDISSYILHDTHNKYTLQFVERTVWQSEGLKWVRKHRL